MPAVIIVGTGDVVVVARAEMQDGGSLDQAIRFIHEHERVHDLRGGKEGCRAWWWSVNEVTWGQSRPR